MSRNRIIYQTEALFVGPSPATGVQINPEASGEGFEAHPYVKQIHRIQSANYGYSLSRRDVNQYGELAAIDRVLLESPVINLDFSYLNSTFYNENALGFYVNSGQGDSSCITNILNKSQDDKNYFSKIVAEGVDAIYNSGIHTHSFIAIGNGFISNFSTEAGIGDFPRTSVTIEGLNIMFQQAKKSEPHIIFSDFFTYNGTGMAIIDNPAINPSNGRPVNLTSTDPLVQYNVIPIATTSPTTGNAHSINGTILTPSPTPFSISALRPGDITLSFLQTTTNNSLQEAGALISDAKIQSYNLNFALTRDPLLKLGSKYAFAREIRFPVQINLSVEANVGDLSTGNLVDMISIDNTYDVRIKIKNPQSGTMDLMVYTLKGAKLDSQAFTSSIGPNKAVTMNFSSQIGGPLQSNKGLFFSGLHIINY